MKSLFLSLLSFVKTHITKIIIIFLSLISAGAIATTVWAIWFREAPTLTPDYAAKETEKDAEKIEGSEGTGESEKFDGGRVNIIYSADVTIDLSDGTASLLIGNLAKSKHNIVAELVIQDNVIMQTGSIQPGYRLTNTEIENGAADILQSGIYNGVIKLYIYDTQTNEREMLSTDIAAKINVRE